MTAGAGPDGVSEWPPAGVAGAMSMRGAARGEAVAVDGEPAAAAETVAAAETAVAVAVEAVAETRMGHQPTVRPRAMVPIAAVTVGAGSAEGAAVPGGAPGRA